MTPDHQKKKKNAPGIKKEVKKMGSWDRGRTGSTQIIQTEIPTLLSKVAISCWLAVDRRKEFIWVFKVSSTSTSIS
jgi:hypothetical protein